jgi:hypothetical protein
VPENLINLWLGHSQNLMDLYAAQLRHDLAYRREWCESAGLGFELGELGYKGRYHTLKQNGKEMVLGKCSG